MHGILVSPEVQGPLEMKNVVVMIAAVVYTFLSLFIMKVRRGRHKVVTDHGFTDGDRVTARSMRRLEVMKGMKRWVLLFVLLGLLLPPGSLAAKKRAPFMIVFDLNGAKLDQDVVKALSKRMRTALVRTGRYRLVDRANQDSILVQQRECRKEIYSAACRIRVGRMAAASKMPIRIGVRTQRRRCT